LVKIFSGKVKTTVVHTTSVRAISCNLEYHSM
jgi:hypothetical protein